MKTIIAILSLLLLASCANWQGVVAGAAGGVARSAPEPTPSVTTTCRQIGDTLYCNSSDGTTTTCKDIGGTIYCH